MTFRGLIKKETKTDCRLFVCVRGRKCYLRSFDQELYSRRKKNRFFAATEQNQNKKPTSRCNTIIHTTKAYILLKRESAVSGSNRRENCKTEKEP
jgi:hypothetical protein